MGLREKAAKGVVWSAIQKWGRDAVSFLTFLILSRLLAPESFGLVALASAFVLSLKVFLDQGFSAAIIQREDLEDEHLDTAFWITFSLGLLLTIAALISAPWIAALFSQPSLTPLLRSLSVCFVISSLSATQTAILHRDLAFKKLAARSLAATLVGGIVGITAALTGFGVWSLVAQVLANNIVGVIVLWRASDWRPGLRVSRKHYDDLFGFGIAVVGNNMLKVVVRRSDDFLIGFFLGPVWLGYYTIGYRLLLVIMRLVTGITNTVAYPIFARLQNEPQRMARAFYQVTQYTSLLAFPVFLGLAVIAPEIVPTLFGAKWSPSIPVMQVLALVGVLQSVTFFNNNIMRACGKPSWEFRLMLLNAVCSVIGFLIAVRWGIVAVAISFVIVGYLLAPVSYLTVRRLLPITLRSYLIQFATPLLASLAMVVAVLATKELSHSFHFHVATELLIYISVAVLVYTTLILMMARPVAWQIFEFVHLAIARNKKRKQPAYGTGAAD